MITSDRWSDCRFRLLTGLRASSCNVIVVVQPDGAETRISICSGLGSVEMHNGTEIKCSDRTRVRPSSVDADGLSRHASILWTCPRRDSADLGYQAHTRGKFYQVGSYALIGIPH